MKITIKIYNFNQQTKICIDEKKNLLTFNGIKKNLNIPEITEKICILVSAWQNSYVNTSNIDGENYEIIIDENEKKFIYSGKNSFPHNYLELKKIVEEVKNAWI